MARRKAGRGDRDRDLAAADHDARHGALGLQIEHVDDVAFGAAFHRLAANGEVEPGGLVDQGDILVALHQIRLGEIGDPERLAGAKLLAHLHADRADRAPAASVPTSALRAPLGHHVGGFQDFVAFDVARQHGGFDGFDRGAGKAQVGRRGAGLVADFEADIEAAAARVEAGRRPAAGRRCWRLRAAYPARRDRRSG